VFSSFDAAGRLTNVRIDNKISKLIGYARLIKCKDDDFHSYVTIHVSIHLDRL